MTDFAPEQIVAVALRIGGLVLSVPRPKRHHDIFHEISRLDLTLGSKPPYAQAQGFITSRGVFVSRFAALEIAKQAGQIKTKLGNHYELFSEDLW